MTNFLKPALPGLSPLKVVQLIGSKNAGGAEMFYLRLITALQQPPFAQQLNVLPVVRRGSWLAAQLTKLDIQHATLPLWGGWDFYSKWHLYRMCKSYQPHVVMAWMNRAAAMLLPQTWVPWVQTARIGGYYKLDNYRRKIAGLVVNTQDLLCYATAGGWPAAQVQVLPNFIPTPAAGWRLTRPAVRKQ